MCAGAFFFFSSRKLIFLLCCRLSRSLARAPRVFCQKEKEYFRLPPFLLLLPTLLLLLLPLGLEHQLVRHQGGHRRRGGDRQRRQRVLAPPDAVGRDGERAHARGEEVVVGEALLLFVVVVVVIEQRVFGLEFQCVSGNSRKGNRGGGDQKKNRERRGGVRVEVDEKRSRKGERASAAER